MLFILLAKVIPMIMILYYLFFLKYSVSIVIVKLLTLLNVNNLTLKTRLFSKIFLICNIIML